MCFVDGPPQLRQRDVPLDVGLGAVGVDVVLDCGFWKRSQRDEDTVLIVVNLDPHTPREATVWLDMPALGMDYGSQFVVTDELSGHSYQWGRANYVRLDPAMTPAHIFTITPQPPS